MRPLALATENGAIINAMSVDVEDYYHVSAFEGILSRARWSEMQSRVCANTTRLLDLFDEFAVRGTFFVLGWVAERHPHLVRDIAARGHEVASHGFEHRLIYEQTADAFREDVSRSKKLLEDLCGSEVAGYRAPSFSVTAKSLWALDILIEEGYAYDASIFPITHDRYGIPGSPRHGYRIEGAASSLIEIPASAFTIGPLTLPVTGGAYFRLFPYWWTKWAAERVNRREHRPIVFYLHPWEIDPGQPRFEEASAFTRLRHYRNLADTEPRLRRMLTEFRFDTVSKLVAGVRVGWQNGSVALSSSTLAPAVRAAR